GGAERALSVRAGLEALAARPSPPARGRIHDTNVQKPATLETGVEVSVPLFINTGDKVKIDTETGAYLERTAIGNG
ncbi:MAG: hypothetical protein AAF449_18170, partial [Myxococcota bacterium]